MHTRYVLTSARNGGTVKLNIDMTMLNPKYLLPNKPMGNHAD